MHASRTVIHSLICTDEADNLYKVQYVTISKRGVPMGSYSITPEPPQAALNFETRYHPELLIDAALRSELRPQGDILDGDVDLATVSPASRTL